jgi:hypothetical protein
MCVRVVCEFCERILRRLAYFACSAVDVGHVDKIQCKQPRLISYLQMPYTFVPHLCAFMREDKVGALKRFVRGFHFQPNSASTLVPSQSRRKNQRSYGKIELN